MADKGARISSDELRKAAAETESELMALLKAEQLSLFGGDPHHVGYTRTNARGTVSNIAAKNPRMQLDAMKKRTEGVSFSQKLAHHGKEAGVSHEEIARASSGEHATEAAFAAGSQEAHARAYYEHTAAAAEATDPVYKLHHQDRAAAHKQTAWSNPDRPEPIANEQTPDRHKAAWSPGGHNADYFAGEGFDVKILGTDSELKSKAFGKKANLGHVAVTLAVTKKAPVAKSLREEITSATMLLKSHVKAYTRRTKSGGVATVAEHDDSRQKHPNIIGTATKMDHKDASKANTFTHAGKLYSSTGKEGRSMHDDRPVREFEEVREGAGHRTWLDHSGNVHADSKEEADRHHKRGMYAEQTKEKKKKAPTAKGDTPPHGDANAKHWANLPDDENPKYTLSGISSEALSHSVKGKDDLNRRAKVELANRGLDSDGKWIGFDKADQHHGLTEKEKGGDPDGDEVSGHLQLAHNKVLSAAAKGHLDLNKRAKHELANRGHDSNGKWIGFDAAEKHHGVK